MIAGYDDAQIANAAVVADVAQSLSLGDRGALLGVMCAMGESSLRNIDYGDWETSGVRNPDGTPTTSIGLFQQQASWGSVTDRMDPIYAAWAFYRALVRVKDWATIAPTLAIHRAQINADPNHYARYEAPARAVLAAIPDLRAKGVIVASDFDMIEVPWQRGMFGRRILIDLLERAGRPRINSMHRVYQDQKDAWDAYRAGRGNPADNPDDPKNYELGHVRGIAVDIDATADNVRRLAAVGLVRPFSWESWHWRIAGNVSRFPLLYSLNVVASVDATPIPKEWDEMASEQQVAAAVEGVVARAIQNALNARPSADKMGRYALVPIKDDGNIYLYNNEVVEAVGDRKGLRKRVRVQSPYHVQLLMRRLDNAADDVMFDEESKIVDWYLDQVDAQETGN